MYDKLNGGHFSNVMKCIRVFRYMELHIRVIRFKFAVTNAC